MTRIVKGSLRYKSAPEVDFSLNVNLEQKQKEQVAYERYVDIDQALLFDQERQISTTIRPCAKISFLFENAYTGTTTYQPFEDNLYIKDLEINGPNFYYPGYPQYNEFDLIRTDYEVPGYTEPPNEHIQFESMSATSYNWNFYISYAYKNNPTAKLRFLPPPPASNSILWDARDGIPFVITNVVYQGANLVSFKCPVKHNMKVGEFVKLLPPYIYNGQNIFEIYSLGDGTSGSEEYTFNIYNYGFDASLNIFADNNNGLCKRVLDINNPIETESKYYVRQHKILTNHDKYILNRAGYEGNIFNIKRQYETSALTSDDVSKIVTKEGNQSYTINFHEDIDISGLLDNQNRPVSELFLTIIHRGYFGWFYEQPNRKLKQGYEFNLPFNPQVSTPKPDSWWQLSFSNVTNVSQSIYTRTQAGTVFTFNYNNTIPTGTTIDGDFCEWNDFDQRETVLSPIYHKFIFNTSVFDISQGISSWDPQTPWGYFYKPHNSIKIRDYSSYVETGNKNNVDLVPDYAYYSQSLESFLWRDLYTYGYIDNEGVGVNYPFLNGAHYPFGDFIFRLIPEGTNAPNFTVINDPITDFCE